MHHPTGTPFTRLFQFRYLDVNAQYSYGKTKFLIKTNPIPPLHYSYHQFHQVFRPEQSLVHVLRIVSLF